MCQVWQYLTGIADPLYFLFIPNMEVYELNIHGFFPLPIPVNAFISKIIFLKLFIPKY